jgi:hypothetical protein
MRQRHRTGSSSTSQSRGSRDLSPAGPRRSARPRATGPASPPRSRAHGQRYAIVDLGRAGPAFTTHERRRDHHHEVAAADSGYLLARAERNGAPAPSWTTAWVRRPRGRRKHVRDAARVTGERRRLSSGQAQIMAAVALTRRGSRSAPSHRRHFAPWPNPVRSSAFATRESPRPSDFDERNRPRLDVAA